MPTYVCERACVCVRTYLCIFLVHVQIRNTGRRQYSRERDEHGMRTSEREGYYKIASEWAKKAEKALRPLPEKFRRRRNVDAHKTTNPRHKYTKKTHTQTKRKTESYTHTCARFYTETDRGKSNVLQCNFPAKACCVGVVAAVVDGRPTQTQLFRPKDKKASLENWHSQNMSNNKNNNNTHTRIHLHTHTHN